MHVQAHARVGSALVATLTAMLLIAVALPASASDTTTTFEVTGGGLSVTAPTSASLGQVANDGTSSVALGAVEALDERGLLTAAYTTSVTSSEFATTVTNADLTTTVVNFGNANVTYTSPAAVVGTGIVTCNGTGTAQGLDASRTAMAATLASGTSSCGWNPTITVTPPTSAVVGTYTGTVTHSVI